LCEARDRIRRAGALIAAHAPGQHVRRKIPHAALRQNREAERDRRRDYRTARVADYMTSAMAVSNNMPVPWPYWFGYSLDDK
jgi:hypothetical protein